MVATLVPFASSARQGRRALWAASLAIFWPGALIFGYPGVMASHWQESLGLSRGAAGGTLFFVLAAIGACMFLVGRLQRRVETGRLVWVGELLAAASLLVTARPTNVVQLYLWGAVAGAASCFVYLPSLTASQLWFPYRRGLASGVFNMAFAGSAALLAPVLGWMVQSLGYSGTHYLLAAAILLCGGAAARGVRRPAAERHGSGTPDRKDSATPSESLRLPAFWFLCLIWALQGSAGIAMVTLAVPLGLSKGVPATAALIILTAFSLANGLSRLVVGFLSDRLGRRACLGVASLAAGLAYLALPQVRDIAVAATLAAVVGVAFGTLFTVSAPLALECFGPEHFGAIFGLVFISYGFLSGLLGPWLSGILLDRAGGDPTAACWYLAPFCLASAALIPWVRPRHRPLVAPNRESGCSQPDIRRRGALRGYVWATGRRRK